MIASILVQPDQKRDAKAAQLAPTVKLWSTVTLKRPHGAFPTGTVFKVAPGSNGASYLVNAVVCECPDYQQAGNICKHVRAIRLAATPPAIEHPFLTDLRYRLAKRADYLRLMNLAPREDDEYNSIEARLLDTQAKITSVAACRE